MVLLNNEIKDITKKKKKEHDFLDYKKKMGFRVFLATKLRGKKMMVFGLRVIWRGILRKLAIAAAAAFFFFSNKIMVKSKYTK